jgi:hypothetical protein
MIDASNRRFAEPIGGNIANTYSEYAHQPD